MAKPLEACMICGDYPCSCNGGKKRAPKVRSKAPKPVADSVAAPKEEIDYGSIPVAKPVFSHVESPHRERDLSRENALRALREIVSPGDQVRIDKELNPPYPQAVDKRIAEWRSR